MVDDSSPIANEIRIVKKLAMIHPQIVTLGPPVEIITLNEVEMHAITLTDVKVNEKFIKVSKPL